MKILVTGCAGFIGYHLCKRLIEGGHTVVGIDNLSGLMSDQRMAELEKIALSDTVLIQSDIQFVKNVFIGNVDAVVHLAAKPGVRESVDKPYDYIIENIMNLQKILGRVQHVNPKRFLFASSSSVYGRAGSVSTPSKETDEVQPLAPYAATKVAGEGLVSAFAANSGIKCISLRLFTVYGPWGRPDMAVWKFTKALRENDPVVLKIAPASRTFTYIDDIVDGIILAGTAPMSPRYAVVNLGNPNSYHTVEDLATTIQTELNIFGDHENIELPEYEMTTTQADITKAIALGWSPSVTLQQGIQNFVNWYKNKYPNPDEIS